MASPIGAALTAVRIADRRHPLFDGYGAFVRGGRWNSPGKRIIYASGTHAGAMLEIIAYANTLKLPSMLVWAEIVVPTGVSVERLMGKQLPGWNRPQSRTARQFGDAWYDGQRSAVLIVPSAVSLPDNNVLFNQTHPDFAKIQCGPSQKVVWDRRILEQLKSRKAVRKR